MSRHRGRRLPRLRRSGLVLATTAAVVLLGATSAAAYWTATGTGTGKAKTATGADIVFTTTASTASAAGLLYPGATVGLSLTVNQIAGQPLTIKTMTPGSVTSSDPTNCPAPWITVASRTGINQAVPAGSGSTTFTIASVVTMSPTAPSTCQGVTFAIPMTLTGVQT